MIFKKCVDGRCLHYSAKLPEQVTKASSYVTGTLHAIEISWVRLGNMQNHLLTQLLVMMVELVTRSASKATLEQLIQGTLPKGFPVYM